MNLSAATGKAALRAVLSLAFLTATSALMAQGDAWPSRPVRIIVPFAAGSGTDITVRIVANALQAKWKHGVVVENKPGATGAIASSELLRNKADAYTLLVGTPSTYSLAKLTLANLDIDPVVAFRPVGSISQGGYLLLVAPQLNVNSVEELIALAKKSPDALTYASSGRGSIPHLTAERLLQEAGIKVVHAPYKSTSTAYPDLASGAISFMFDFFPSAIAQARGGRVKAIGVTTASREPLAYEIPTISDGGPKGFESIAWVGLFANKDIPAALVRRMSDDLRETVSQPEIRARFTAAGLRADPTTPEQLAAKVQTDIKVWGGVISKAGVKLE